MFNKLILATSVLLASSFFADVTDASMAPSYPSPGTVWKSGQQYDILWADDATAPSIASGWKDFKIDFMTGDNNQQIFLSNVASNLDGTKISKFTWTAPEVKPNAAIYFFMFSNGKDSAWTTRFGITGADGVLADPENPTQPTGEKIPWGVGALASGGGSNSTTPGSSSQSAASSSVSASASGSAAASSSVTPEVNPSSSASGLSSSSASAAGISSSASAASASASGKANSGADSLARPLAGFAIAAVAAGILV